MNGLQRTPGKRDFTDLYTSSTPQAYVRYFAALEYRVLGAGVELFRRVIDALGEPSAVADVCCSYGQDAALLNHTLTVQELFRHWGEAPDDLDRDAMLARDAAFFAAHRRPDAVTVLGLDSSVPAVAYGLDSGLLSGGLAADPENNEVDLSIFARSEAIVVTGGIGYVGERTYAQLLDACEQRPWVAGMVLRWVDLAPVTAVLRERGYTVQVASEHPVVQRRVADDVEATAMRSGLDRLGRTPGPLEARGYHAAVPFLAVPPGSAVPDLQRLGADLDPGTS